MSNINNSAKWVSTYSFIVMMTGILQILIFSKFLTPEDFGLIAIFSSIYLIAKTFISTGFSDSIISKDNIEYLQLCTLYWINIFVGISVSAMLYLLSPVISQIFSNDLLENIMKVLSLVIFISSFSTQFEALIRKSLQFKLLAKIQITSVIIGFFLSIILIFNGFQIWAMIIGFSFTKIMDAVILFVYFWKNDLLIEFKYNFNQVRDFLNFGMYRIVASLINQFNAQSDQIIIGMLLGPKVLGYYFIAYQLVVQPLSRINPILSQLAFPVFSKNKHNKDILKRGYIKGLRVLSAINTPLLIGIFIVSPDLVPVILGPGWEQSIILVQILSIFILLRSFGNMSVSLLLAKEKYKWPFYWNFSVFLIKPLTIFFVITVTGSIVAAAISLVALELVFLTLNYALYVRTLLGKILKDLSKAVIAPISISICMALLIYFGKYIFNIDSKILGLLISVSVGVFFYLVVLYVYQKKVFNEIYVIFRS